MNETPRTQKRIAELENYGLQQDGFIFKDQFGNTIELNRIRLAEHKEWHQIVEPFSPDGMKKRIRELIRSGKDNTEQIKFLNEQLDKFNYGY